MEFSADGLDGPDHTYIHLKVCDEHDACSYGRARVDILNVAPVLGAITAPVDPVSIGTEITVSANFTDAGIPDTHTATTSGW